MNALKQFILDHKSLRWLLLFTNWAYQGIPQSDFSEKIYKISFTIVSSIIVLFFIGFSITNSVVSLIIGHTLSWIINSNISVILIHRMKYFKTDKNNLFGHISDIQNRLKSKDWVLFSVSSGGIIRGSMNEHSDIDVNVVRKKGFLNALHSIVFAVKERKIADYKGIPLDVIISDSVEDCLEKTSYTEDIVILTDTNNLVKKYYKRPITLSDAENLNKSNKL